MVGYPIKQSQTAQPLEFLMVDSTDHVTAKTGLTPTVTLSKNGGAFASPAGAVTEIGNGWYKVAGNATDANTLGPLLLHATGTGADPADGRFDVVAYDPQDAAALGLSRVDAAISTRSTYAGGAVASVTAAVTVGTNNDKTGYALTAGERTAIANEVEAQIIDDTDSERVLQAIVDKIAAANPSLDDLTLGAIASAVRTELTVELTRIDAAITSRLASVGYTAPDNASIAAVKLKTDNLPPDPADASDIAGAFATVAAAIGALSIPTTEQNATDLLDLADGVETGTTLRQALRISLSVLAGKLLGAETNTPAFRDINDTKDRVTATTDVNGNRLTVVVDAA